jgi:hypothetical protein
VHHILVYEAKTSQWEKDLISTKDILFRDRDRSNPGTPEHRNNGIMNREYAKRPSTTGGGWWVFSGTCSKPEALKIN